MFENIKYKHKRTLVFVFSLLLFILFYKKFLKNTINLVDRYSYSKSQSIDSLETKSKIKSIKLEIEKLNKIVGREENNQDLVQQQILSFTSKNNTKIVIKSLDKTHIFENNDFIVHSNILTVEGQYNLLLQYIYSVNIYFMLSKKCFS